VLDRIRAYADGLTARANTALYDALVSAYDVLRAESPADPDRITSVVLLTDGEANTGRGLADFTAHLRQLPPDLAAVPVFPVLVGEADAAQLSAVATATGGQVFDVAGRWPTRSRRSGGTSNMLSEESLPISPASGLFVAYGH
jgi:Ca-activated chloride channel homolog